MGIIPFAISSYIAVNKSSNVFVAEVHEKIKGTSSLKKQQLESVFSRWYSNANFFSSSRKLQDLFVEMDSGGWSSVSKYHNYLQELTDESLFSDLIFVTDEGRILGSVNNEVLINSNMNQFNGKALYDIWETTKNSKTQERALFSPLQQYSSFNNNFQSFLVVKFKKNSKDRGRWLKGESIGTMILALPSSEINKVVNNRIGMGKTGETYLVSKGLDGSTFYTSDRVVKKGAIGDKKGGGSIEKLFSSKSDFNNTKVGSTGVTEIVYSTYFKFNDVELGMFSTQSQDEALTAVGELLKIFGLLALVFCTLIFFIAIGISNRISKPIITISNNLFNNAEDVSVASKNIARSSSDLASATTEQAAGLQETVS